MVTNSNVSTMCFQHTIELFKTVSLIEHITLLHIQTAIIPKFAEFLAVSVPRRIRTYSNHGLNIWWTSQTFCHIITPTQRVYSKDISSVTQFKCEFNLKFSKSDDSSILVANNGCKEKLETDNKRYRTFWIEFNLF